MACTSYTLSGLNASCKNSIGGVDKIWLADSDSVPWTIDSSTKQIKPDATTAFKLYKLRRGAASATSNWVVNENNAYSQTDLTMNIGKPIKNLKNLALILLL